MKSSRQAMIDHIESYYAAVDRFDTDEIVAHFTPGATMEVPTGAATHIGQAALRETYDRRAGEIVESFHGHFTHVVDDVNDRATTRLAVHRTASDGQYAELDCIALFEFDGDLIKHIVIWMSGENTLK
jgi:ketosteroid isomerase-like protein